jgi:hypothetical protein
MESAARTKFLKATELKWFKDGTINALSVQSDTVINGGESKLNPKILKEPKP